MTRAPRRWTCQEDETLKLHASAQITENGEINDWKSISTQLPGRNNKDCRKRWLNVVSGDHKKGNWTSQEDKCLSEAVEEYGQNWAMVARVIEARSADQCAKRWKQFLDPELNRSPWTDEENRRLLDAYSRKGARWKEIQTECFPTRASDTIRNQFTTLSRRQQGASNNNPNDQTTESQPEEGDFEDLVGSPDDDLSVGNGNTGQEALNSGDAIPVGNADCSWYPVDPLTPDFSPLNGGDELRPLPNPMDSLNALPLPNQSPILLQSPFGPMPSIADPPILPLDPGEPGSTAISDQPGSPPRQISLSVSKPSVKTANLLLEIAYGTECEQCRLKVKR